MTSKNIGSDAQNDLVQETVTQYTSKLLDRGAEALRKLATDVRALAGAAADRATHFKSMLVNLDVLSDSVALQLSGADVSKMSPEARAFADAYRRESGKAQGFFSSAVQSEKASTALSVFSKNLGGLVSAIGFISTVADPQATEYSVGRELGALGAGILAGGIVALGTTAVFPVVLAGVGGAIAGRAAWDVYAKAIGWDEKTSPNFHATMRSTFSTVRNAFGFTIDGEANGSAFDQMEKKLSSDLTGTALITWPDGTRQVVQTDSTEIQSELKFRKDGGYTKITRNLDGRTGYDTVDSIGGTKSFQPIVPAGVTLGPNQFYVDERANTLVTISDVTGVSSSTLMGLNPALGLGAVRNFVFKAYDAPQEKICLAKPRPHR
jgi:hypothetical protein